MMGRLLAVVTLVVGFASTAHAKRAPACDCARNEVFPTYEDGDIPTNQRAIEFRPWDDKEPIKVTPLGDLEPNTEYHFDNPIYLSIKTGNGPDLRVPAAPKVVHPSIAIARSNATRNPQSSVPATSVSMYGDYDDDTTYLEVEITAHDGQVAHFGMHVSNPFMCGAPVMKLTPGPATVKVWALDRTGNRSAEPWVGETTITFVDTDPTDGMCLEHHYRCGLSATMALLVIVPFYFVFALVVLWIISGVRRMRVRKWPGDHVSIPLGESVARIAARMKAIRFLVGVGTVAALWNLDYMWTAFLVSPILLPWLLDMARAAGVVRRFNHPVNRLERRDDWLLVDHTLLYCGRIAWNRASRVPTATINKR